MKKIFKILLIALVISGCASSREVFNTDADADADSDLDADTDSEADSEPDAEQDADETGQLGRNYLNMTFAENGDVFAVVRAFSYTDPCGTFTNYRRQVLRITPDEEITVLFELSDWNGMGLFDAAKDGSRFLIENTDRDFVLYDDEGTELRTFSSADFDDINLSDDGLWIAYVDGGISGIHVMEIPEGMPERVTFDGHSPSLSPDNSRIALLRGANGGLWVVDADGSYGFKLKSVAVGLLSSSILWSSDGLMLYFISEGGFYSAQISEYALRTEIFDCDPKSHIYCDRIVELSNDGERFISLHDLDGFGVLSTEDGSLSFEILGDYLCG